jgi:hypothetical protein
VPTITGRFADSATADAAREALAADTFDVAIGGGGSDLGTRETRFMGRIVILVALWSVVGTALGAGLGVVIAMIFGPDGTDGMVIQGISWAIFAHLLAGMWAGYWLLADRSRAEMPIPSGAVLLTIECASIDGTERAVARLRELGATHIETNG